MHKFFVSLRERLPLGLRRNVARVVVKLLDVVRPFERSGLARGMMTPSRMAPHASIRSVGVRAAVHTVVVQEARPTLRSPDLTNTPPHREIDNAYVCLDVASADVTLRNNHLIGPDRVVVSESRARFDELRISISRLQPVVHRVGTTAFLSNIWVDNYYHWLCFTLPNVRLIREALGVSPDHYYVGRPLKPWHLETLAAVGIDPRQVLSGGTTSDRVVAVFPDRVGALDGLAIEFVRQALLPDPPVMTPGRRLYVGRGRTRHRRLLNAEACESMLRQKYGFETITMDGLTVAEQAETFARASLIVAPHGAALTNVMFASNGANVVELVPHDATNPEFSYFAELCAHVGCSYSRVRGSALDGPATRATLQDIRVDLDELDRTIATLLEC